MPPLKIALIYDFDGTLSPVNMQEYDFIPSIGKQASEFWDESNELAREADADPIQAYLYLMLREADKNDVKLRREDFQSLGRKIRYFAGVEEWFDRINAYAAGRDIEIDHYINSSGIKEMIEGTSIFRHFAKVFACSFIYDIYGIARWPAIAVNYTNKTQFLFKINKGIASVYDNTLINGYMPEAERPMPFRRMIYIGDGTTDIPCMRLVKEKGGHAIAVYNPAAAEDDRGTVAQLVAEERVNFVAEADYSAGSRIDRLVKAVIDKIAADETLNRFSCK